MKDKLYRCNKAKTENCEWPLFCEHYFSHEKSEKCFDEKCYGIKVKCIPYQEERK
jgi:hypothetical protein